MSDWAHDWTDDRIDELERRFASAYSQAAREMREKLAKSFADQQEAQKTWRERVRSGEATSEEYKEWLRRRANDRKFISGLAQTLADDASRANQLARDYINDEIPRVYAENANFSAYGIEREIGYDTHSFDLYDQSTVRRLIGLSEHDQIIHEVIPVGPPRPELQSLRVNLDAAKDVRWNRQKFTSAITQSILQGESVPNAAKRLMVVLNMDRGMAVRAARTAMTSAENAGRVDSYKRAERIGIRLEQQWMATLDERTRYSHRELDGQHVPVGKKFVAKSTGHELEFPGDPKAHPSEVWNCRCTLVAWSPEMEAEDANTKRFTRLPKGMTYEQWKGAKEQEKKSSDRNPQTLAGVRRGRPMTFDEANELKGNPNYNMASLRYNELLKARQRYNEAIDKYGFSSQEFLDANRALDDAQTAYKKAQREQSGYRINCQTCVVANEARRRGYDVQATANTTGSTNARVARQTNLAWIDRATGKHPDYIIYDGEGKKDYAGRPIPTYARYVKWLESEGTIEEGARYTIGFWWKGRSSSGHIVSIERTSEGLRMYDPQCGESYDGKGIREYLKRVKYKSSIRGTQIADGPQLLKVSDYDFDLEICEQILMGRK